MASKWRHSGKSCRRTGHGNGIPVGLWPLVPLTIGFGNAASTGVPPPPTHLIRTESPGARQALETRDLAHLCTSPPTSSLSCCVGGSATTSLPGGSRRFVSRRLERRSFVSWHLDLALRITQITSHPWSPGTGSEPFLCPFPVPGVGVHEALRGW